MIKVAAGMMLMLVLGVAGMYGYDVSMTAWPVFQGWLGAAIPVTLVLCGVLMGILLTAQE